MEETFILILSYRKHWWSWKINYEIFPGGFEDYTDAINYCEAAFGIDPSRWLIRGIGLRAKYKRCHWILASSENLKDFAMELKLKNELAQ